MNRRIVLAAKPQGRLDAAHFRLEEAPMPEPAPGELLVRVRMLSIDAANRAWMQAATYRDELQAGTVMAGTGVGQVIASRAEGFAPGGVSLHNCMLPHGPDSAAFETASTVELKPMKLSNTLAFMFESRFPQAPTDFAATSDSLQHDYAACWAGLGKRFTGKP